jgi:hypothetical protein
MARNNDMTHRFTLSANVGNPEYVLLVVLSVCGKPQEAFFA